MGYLEESFDVRAHSEDSIESGIPLVVIGYPSWRSRRVR